MYLIFYYYTGIVLVALKWLFNSKEITNFTYDLTERNEEYLLSMISIVTDVKVEQLRKYLKEIENDSTLNNHITEVVKSSNEKYVSESRVAYGRRIGWYVLIRAIKPKIVVETGVDKGLGSCVIVSALIRNKRDGFEGYYFGTDINPDAGFMFKSPYSSFGEILFGDSIKSLKSLNKKIDLFINDSAHTYEYEKDEYEIVNSKLTSKAVIIADNAHSSSALFEFAEKTGRRFLFFREEVKNHWYPGGGIGLAFK